MKSAQELYQSYIELDIANQDEAFYHGWMASFSSEEKELFLNYLREKEQKQEERKPGLIFLTENMFKSGQPVAQGEVLIWMKKYAPQSVLNAVAGLKNLQPMKLENDQLIVGHSESGHHHVLEPVAEQESISNVVRALIDAANDSFMLLEAKSDFQLVHLRSTDTHGGFVFPPGEYIRGIREEQSIEGWRRVQD